MKSKEYLDKREAELNYDICEVKKLQLLNRAVSGTVLFLMGGFFVYICMSGILLDFIKHIK